MRTLQKRTFILFIVLQLICSSKLLYVHANQSQLTGLSQSLQYRIDNAMNHDIIHIPNGTYYEHLIINKPLTIIGDNHTIVDGSFQNTLLTILSDDVSIINITFQSSGGEKYDSGIYVKGTNITIWNCSFFYVKHGIFLDQVQNVLINQSDFSQNGKSIVIKDSNQIIIESCLFSHSGIGVFLNYSNMVSIDDSVFITNGISLYSLNSDQLSFFHSTVKDNSDNHGGIFLQESSSITIDQTTINHNGIGVNIDRSDHIMIKNSRITNNTHFGVLIRKQTDQIAIKENSIDNNLRFGIYCYEDTIVTVKRNIIINNLLFGLYSKEPVFVLDENWWGSSMGPSISSFSDINRISLNNYVFHFNRWSNEPIIFTSLTINQFSEPDQYIIQDISNHIIGIDSDGDGAPDWWEEKWGYPPLTKNQHHIRDDDEDGLTNIQECYTDQWGSDPYKKDIFLEIDWIKTANPWYTNKPSSYLLEKVKTTFSIHNISLHIDDGSMGEGGEIPNQKTDDFSSMIDIYWNQFLNSQITNPRKGIFHYAIIADECADVSYPFFGWDSFDSIAISSEKAKMISPQYSRQMIIVGGIIHQLGSTLGLVAQIHQGNDNWLANTIGTVEWLKYHQYKSSMNYLYKYRLLSYSDGLSGQYDFNDWTHLDFSFFMDTSFHLS